jgi:Mu-like prophage I protein
MSRFSRLSSALAAKGAHNPDALAAHIGRKKYGRAGMAALAAAGRAKRRVKRAVSASKDLLNVELARPGTWNLKSGPQTITPRMLDDAARFAARDGARPGYVKIGHTDPRFMAGDGEPALGWLHNIRVEEDNGPVLKGDLTGLPDWLAAAIPTHWPDRSIEGYADYVHDGQTYGLVVDGLALLGVTPPGMSNIRSLRDLPAALGIAASLEPSGTRIIATFGASAPASEAEVPTNERTGMDPVLAREALGLPADASDEEVRAAFLAAFPDDTQESDQKVAAAAARSGGVITIDKTQLEMFEEGMKRAQRLEARLEQEERDKVITEAVRVGKFPPARREHYERSWTADPAGTKQLIASLAPGLVPVTASGYSGDVEHEDDDLDREIARLSPPMGKVG